MLLVYDTDQDWLLVQSQKEDGKAGYVPGNYVEATTEEDSISAPAVDVPSVSTPALMSYQAHMPPRRGLPVYMSILQIGSPLPNPRSSVGILSRHGLLQILTRKGKRRKEL